MTSNIVYFFYSGIRPHMKTNSVYPKQSPKEETHLRISGHLWTKSEVTAVAMVTRRK